MSVGSVTGLRNYLVLADETPQSRIEVSFQASGLCLFVRNHGTIAVCIAESDALIGGDSGYVRTNGALDTVSTDDNVRFVCGAIRKRDEVSRRVVRRW